MKFAYEDLSPKQFENLIVFLCQRLLGISTQGFSEGPDGGRDAKFDGTADLHPSKSAPWIGITIIQAKHTNGYNRTFSETDFFSAKSPKNTVVGKEISRIKKLRDTKQLDHYMLFANRRLSGNAEADIRDYISSQCNIPRSSLYLCGVEQLENWLKTFPDVAKNADLDSIDSPLIVSPDELANIVEALAQNRDLVKDGVAKALDKPPTARVAYKEKNTLNNMTDAYANEMLKKYLKETPKIKEFLAAPENVELLHLYESVVNEFQFKIIAKRKDYQTFDQIMEYLLNLLFARDVDLRRNKRLTRTVLFYMYWNCDIGDVGDATAN